MSDHKKLLNKVGRFEADEIEFAGLDQTERSLRERAEIVMAQLEKSGGARLLVNAAGRDVKLPEEEAGLLDELRMIQTKLDLLPGVRRKLQEDLGRESAALLGVLREVFEQCRARAREKTEELRSKVLADFLPVCGGDPGRAKAVATAAADACEWNRWREYFVSLPDQERLGDRVRKGLAMVADFDAGRPCLPSLKS